VTPAGVSVTVHIFFFGLAATVPFFLMARERPVQALQPAAGAVDPTQGDLVGLVLFALPTLALSL
jgi:hypothetical protein